MHYVIIHHNIKENISEEEIKPHVDYLRKLYDEGKLIITGPFLDEKKGGMFVIEAEAEDELHKIVFNDPAVENGLSKPEIRPYKIVFRK